ncbi:MAG: NrfD/PsrC family molybdoenzyme membrane anchor subunit [Candidatus Thiodiazotropha endolucinida]|uniref:Polysulfide reductase, NrfD n=2 Tax=Candidatus Thiodiazotropha TaxID=1913444 RepID=A0A7Z0VKZ4_9GAMM|nr:NrfD/PsrC family molybdoenzyme membrane anchor subunit [Candidatus Thiodiazotropha endolucinida]MCG7979076.1 polysulfide reductase NrfD [Candidatus Thiodiazotropha taylori]MCG7861886.1 polysulfide reductase NrfD [Candidatus Thiodiazotropha endolucinida]MCG8048171.1 polysulfide reductase NrfD [Candidatus Thiodiazotropha taylori]MCG8059665.1 polysulfide reductase NrfD [Candidatus Thiodiazotropha taylori]MCG8063567.1 polysulfide reductase NrfD [Candidatus Thiodiazotropha taylori]
MSKMYYRELYCGSPVRFWMGLALLGAFIAVGLGAAYFMEHQGHWVTGMSNQIVWGLPHVFAIFLIVAASGALNVASIGSVFGGPLYKPLGRFSGLLAIGLLVGGLMVLVLDLGRPDRLIVAMTEYNFKSIFAWNVILYSGFIAIVAVYLWAMIDRGMERFKRPLGFAAFFWRIALTTGTGSIFGFLVAREAYDAAIMAPMFVIMSFSYGLAFFIITLIAAYMWGDRELGDLRLTRLKNLLGVFVGAVLYFVLAYNLTNLYATQHHGIERFILLDGGIYTVMFWIGQILIGSIIPLFLIYSPAFEKSRWAIAAASVAVLIGGFFQIYIIVIAGQAYPMNLFPGKEVIESGFFDGQVANYIPTFPEAALGVAGIAVALALVAIGARIIKVFPETLED